MFSGGGVYEILNTVNGKRYIGSSVALKERRSQHFRQLRQGVHHSTPLQRAWNKYGELSFKFLPILTCAKSMLLFYEQQLLDKVRPEYNVALDATAPTLGLKFSAETKAKMSSARAGRPGRKWTEKERVAASIARTGRPGHPQSQAARDKLAAARIGVPLTDSHRAKLSLAKKGKLRGPLSEKTKEKIRQAAIGRVHSAEAKKKIGDVQRGRSLPQKTCEKISLNNIRRHAYRRLMQFQGALA